MEPQTVADAGRRDALVSVAAGMFVRFGFRKTSMEEVARAARLSRQGLYFHFANKEALFCAVVGDLAEGAFDALSRELGRTDLALAERLYAAFMAMDARVFGDQDSTHVREVFATAAELCPDVLADLDARIIGAVARALGAPPRGGIPAKTLAEHLYVASYGFKYRGLSQRDYAARMKAAVRIVCAAHDTEE